MDQSTIGMSKHSLTDDKLAILELLPQQYKDDPLFLLNLQQLIHQASPSSSSSGTNSTYPPATPTRTSNASIGYAENADTLLNGIINQLESAQIESQIQKVQSQLLAQQEVLRRGAGLSCAEPVYEERNMSAQLVYPGLEQVPPHDFMNIPSQSAVGIQETLMRYLGHSDKLNLPLQQLRGSPSSSPPESFRGMKKQVSMPGSKLAVPHLNILQTPFNAFAAYPFHNEGFLSAHSAPSGVLNSYRQRHNSDPVLSADLDLVKAEDLKHMLQKLPPAYNAASVVSPFLPQMDVKSCCQLLKGLGKCNLHSRAWQIFQLIREIPVGQLGAHLRTTDVYNQMIQLFQSNTCNALQIFDALVEDNLMPDSSVYGSLLGCCGRCEEFERAEELYSKAYEQKCIDKEIAATMVDILSRTEQFSKITTVLQHLKFCGTQPDVQLYNSVINLTCKKQQFEIALRLYKCLLEDDLVPSHKTLLVIRPAVEALFCAQQLPETEEQQVISKKLIAAYMELIANHTPQKYRSNLCQILMTSFDKQGEVGHAISLYDTLRENNTSGKQLSLEFCNLAISACAHQGFYVKAQAIFDDMENCCEVGPSAVTFANLLRAYKKGGQPFAAVLVFENMKKAGFQPHGAVYGSCLDLCWKAGVGWALQKASQILIEGFERKLLDQPEEALQRNTLRLDLRALTCGAAVLTMKQWLLCLRERLVSAADPALLCVKRLVIVNGVGEGTKGQTSCTVVKNAVASSLQGFRSPFTLTQDSRLLKLEAPMGVLKDWLFSDSFGAYCASFGPQNTPLMPVDKYLEIDNKLSAECGQLYNQLCKQQALARANLQTMNPDYLQARLSLIVHLQELHARLNLSEVSLFGCIQLMDILMSSGGSVGVSGWELVRLPILCTHFIQAADEAKTNTLSLFAGLAQCNTEQFSAFVQKFARFVPQPLQFLVTPIHFLRLFAERLGMSMEDSNTQTQLSMCNQLVLDVISKPLSVQFPPSIIASSIIKMFRKQVGMAPDWPSVLAQLTSYPEDHPNLIECQKLVSINSNKPSTA